MKTIKLLFGLIANIIAAMSGFVAATRNIGMAVEAVTEEIVVDVKSESLDKLKEMREEHGDEKIDTLLAEIRGNKSE